MANDIDPALVQLLAQRMNLSQDEIAAIERGEMSNVFTRRFAGDPEMAPLLQFVQSNEQTSEPGQTESVARRRKRGRGTNRARRTMHRVHEELRAAQIVVHHVARIFGACSYCFGDDSECPYCEGHGGPGSDTPARDELLAWAEPALARLGLKITNIEK